MRAKIILSYKNQKVAKAISDAISPDNIRTYKNLLVETCRISNEVLTFIEYREDNQDSFQSTINDLLSCVSIAERSCKAIIKI
jgi:hypothetical protein